jgi:hypothetical protein
MATNQQHELPSESDNNLAAVVDDLSMLVRRLVHSLKKRPLTMSWRGRHWTTCGVKA